MKANQSISSGKDERNGAIIEFSKVEYIDIDNIEVNRKNPREKISRSEVADLIYSIRSVGGILVPIVVYYDPIIKKYKLLDGERRYRAAKELAKANVRFQKIPANIISRPLTETENLEAMLNIHFKRKQWSTAATALAFGSLIKSLGEVSTIELSKKTGLTTTAIKEARLFLRIPKDIQKRCYDGELDEYYVILLARNLETCESNFKDIFKRHDWDFVIRAFIGKVDENWIRNAREFNKISTMARTCIRLNQRELFVSTFERMLSEPSLTPTKAEKLINQELSVGFDDLFLNECNTFASRLKQYSTRLEKQKGSLPTSLMDSLKEIKSLVESVVKRVR